MTTKSSVILTLVAFLSLCRAAVAGPADEDFFEIKIRPLLVGKCFKCHGGEKVSSGLRIDSRQALVKGGKHGAAIVPGDPEGSLLIDAVKYGERKMPPDAALPSEAVADLVEWIQRGAVWPEGTAALDDGALGRHWAFQPVRAVTVPDDASGWAEQPIDRFIAARLAQEDLTPVAPADRTTLVRRVYFDLIGLPPTPDEVDEFVNDDRPDALRRLVERLLASPHYGERWGRHWMDVVRYADTAGDNADYPVPEARLYRDYIIDAFNADKPYDEFVREQLAGDLLAADVSDDPRRYAERVAATGYLALARRYATGPYELWHVTLEDAIDTTGRALMGLTLRCARCHDHKFDPVTTEDYYALYGIFASTRFAWAGAEELHSKGLPRQHFVPVVPPDVAAPRLDAYRQEIAAREAELASLEKQPAGADGQATAKLNELKNQLRLLRRAGLPSDLPGAYAVSEGPVIETRVQRAGEPSNLGDVVTRGVPAFLPGGGALDIPPGASGRRQLAEWITRPDHPLTARVMVNRVWQHHFGKGLVATPSNFGLRGEPPRHPQLLDWLAARFVESGWSIKQLHRMIVLSKVYQLASDDDPARSAKDPANRWYWRYDRRRLEAEAIRDAMLAVGEGLDRSRAGEHPFPPMNTWTWTQHNPFKAVYPSNHRSVYLMTQRIQRHPYLALFDGPDPNASTDMRTSATVPPQALYLMNNPFVSEQASRLARRLMAATGDVRARIDLGHRLAYGRHARADEIDRAAEFLNRYQAELARQSVSAAEAEAWSSYARILLTANEFVYLD